MKKIIFLAHDPGGYDVIFPVADSLIKQDIPCEFYCIGPAAKLNSKYCITHEKLPMLIKKLIKEERVVGLVTGTSWGNHIELEIIELCKENNIKTISILDYWCNYAMRFQKENGEYVYPDHYLVMDEIAKKEAIEHGVPKGILKIVGQPGLDKYVSYQENNKKKTAEQIRMLFLSQPLSSLYGEMLGYTEQKVLGDLIKVTKKYKYHLNVKFHPKDVIEFQNKYVDIAVQGNLMDIMPKYDLVIGMSTMGILHAILMGIKVISYQPGLCKDDSCITNKFGITKLVNSYQGLEDLLLKMNITEKQEIENKQCIWMDGKSTERVVEFIKLYFINEFSYL